MSARGIEPDVEARLTRLEAASDERSRQLREVVQHLPAEVSRRDVVRDSIADLRDGSIVALVRHGVRSVRSFVRRLTGWARARRSW